MTMELCIGLNKLQSSNIDEIDIVPMVANMTNEKERLHHSLFPIQEVRRILCCLVTLNPLCWAILLTEKVFPSFSENLNRLN